MTAKGYELGGKHANDPIGSEKPRGKDAFERRGRFDSGRTPTEKVQKARLMRQFMRTKEGDGGNSVLWRESEVWCVRCGLYMRQDDSTQCRRCNDAAQVAPEEWRP